jgi:uncharacterized protein
VDVDILRELCASLPIFPLPNTVLLPGSVLPLHVFEPRYRALVDVCLRDGMTMGIATLKPGYEPSYAGNPDIWPIIGVGQIVGHQPFPDGRSNIVLQYVGRARVREELPSEHPFRLVHAEVLEDEAGGLGPSLTSLRQLVLQLGGLFPAAGSEAARLADLSGMELADELARRLLEGPDEQRAYLAADRLADRVSQVHQRLAAFLGPLPPVAES